MLTRWAIWHLAVFGRAQTIPSLEEVMGQQAEMEGEDEVAAKLDTWMVMHNAKLAPDERHYVVAELVEDV